MDREISLTYSLQLVRASYFHHGKSILFASLLLILFTGLESAGFFNLGDDEYLGSRKQEVFTILFFIILFFFFYLFYSYWYYYERFTKLLRKMATPVFNFRLSDEYLSLQNDLFSGQYKWVIFSRLDKFKKVWLLYTQGNAFFILPTEQLDPELQQFLQTKVASKKPATGKILILLAILFSVLFAHSLALRFLNSH